MENNGIPINQIIQIYLSSSTPLHFIMPKKKKEFNVTRDRKIYMPDISIATRTTFLKLYILFHLKDHKLKPRHEEFYPIIKVVTIRKKIGKKKRKELV